MAHRAPPPSLLGRAPREATAADAVDWLLECHARIRSFGDTARRLGAAARDELDAATVLDAAERVRRYFRMALPLHVRDEEDTLRPRLAGRSAALDDALARMAEEHAEHDPHTTAVAAICERLAAAAPETAVLDEWESSRADLLGHAGELVAAWDRHLAAEEQVILPAVRRLLAPEELDEVLEEMKARRRDPP